MRATLMYGAGDVRVENVPDPHIQRPTDAIVRVAVRAYIEELLPAVLDGTVDPGRVFDRTVNLDQIADGYRAMNDRTALKVLVTPSSTRLRPRQSSTGTGGAR
jgi:threonine dehydrogenase-like Zn-dependent dehydrogenase